jgi:hypothetical protein
MKTIVGVLIKCIAEFNTFFNCQIFRAALQDGGIRHRSSRVLI